MVVLDASICLTWANLYTDMHGLGEFCDLAIMDVNKDKRKIQIGQGGAISESVNFYLLRLNNETWAACLLLS